MGSVNEWGGDMIMSHGSSNSCGVAVLSKKGLIALFCQNSKTHWGAI